MDNVTPKKSLIVASGVKNHKEYVDLVKERLGELLPVPEHEYKRNPAVYIGGEYRTWTETPQTNIMLAFESASWAETNIPVYYLMNTIIGSGTSFSSGQPGKGLYSRAVTNLLQKYNYVDGVSAINAHFSDSGIFGLSIEGPSSHSQDLMHVLLEELNRLKEPISDEELNRNKNILKMQILTQLEKQEDRLEEIARNFQSWGDLTFHKYCDQIDAVTTQQINEAATKCFARNPTLLVTGGAINLVPNITDVSRQLQ